jgi:hypothetical protein
MDRYQQYQQTEVDKVDKVDSFQPFALFFDLFFYNSNSYGKGLKLSTLSTSST